MAQTIKQFGRLDILVNNAAEQHPQDSLEDIDTSQLDATFRTNVFAMFHVTRAALPHLHEGRVDPEHDVGDGLPRQRSPARLFRNERAIVSFTRSLALQIVKRGIRVNGVAPGPILDAADSVHVQRGSTTPAR